VRSSGIFAEISSLTMDPIRSWSCIPLKLRVDGITGVSKFARFTLARLLTSRLSAIADVHAVGEGTPWDFLGATSVQEGHNRALIRPAHGAPSFDPAVRQDGSPGFAHKRSMIAQRAQAQRQQAKRDSYIGDHGPAVQVWDKGCQVAKIFGDAGSM